MRRSLATLGVVLLAALPAQGSLLGTQIIGAFIDPLGVDIFARNPQPASVTATGVEFVGPVSAATSIEADFDAATLTVFLTTFAGASSFLAFDASFTFLTPGLVTGVDVLPGGTVGLSVAPALAGDVLTFRTPFISNTPPNTTLSVTLRLSTRAGTPVPAPGALALFGVALLGFAAAARRRG